MNADELVWIDRMVTRTRYSIFRTRAGLHYEAALPRDGWDEEVAYRVDTVTSGTVFGAYPDLGVVSQRFDEPPRTEVTLPAEIGPWIRHG